MPKPGTEACLTCQYYGLEATPNPDTGWCVRHPPIPVNTSIGALDPAGRITMHWPIVHADHWCGEYLKTVAATA